MNSNGKVKEVIMNILTYQLKIHFSFQEDFQKEGDFCYFRYENINSPQIAQFTEQDLVFYFEFTYGTADIYASLFETGNNGIILQNYIKEIIKVFSAINI